MTNVSHITLSFVTIAALLAPVRIDAQTRRPTADGTQHHSIASRMLGATRTIDVTLPHGYAADSTARYPIIVVLDGELEGELAAATARFYADVGMLPSAIVVAVPNVDRLRDLTPAAVAPFQPPPGTSGGADRFLAFLADEVLPFVDRTYRTAPMRVLIGHSLGGLFALHALAKRPETFTGYVVMEPSTWWNDQQPRQAARDALTRPATRRARVMLVNAPSIGSDTMSWGGTRPMVREIRVADETHASMAAVGIASGLRRMFEDFRPPQWRPGTSPIEMLARYDSLAARIGYAVPVPAESFGIIVRMCLDSRFFDDAERALARMERTLGASAQSRAFRTRLATERTQPAPTGFIPLVIPARRPTPAQAARFIGRWRSVDARIPHEVEIRRAGDTIVVHDHVTFPEGEPFDADDPVITITSDGTLEWGLPFFRGIAALEVLKGTLADDDTMVVRREARGWVPRDPGYGARPVVRFARVR